MIPLTFTMISSEGEQWGRDQIYPVSMIFIEFLCLCFNS